MNPSRDKKNKLFPRIRRISMAETISSNNSQNQAVDKTQALGIRQ